MIILYTELQYNDGQPSICNTPALFIKYPRLPNGATMVVMLFTILLLTITWQLSKFSYLLLLLNIGQERVAKHAADIHSPYHFVLPGNDPISRNKYPIIYL